MLLHKVILPGVLGFVCSDDGEKVVSLEELATSVKTEMVRFSIRVQYTRLLFNSISAFTKVIRQVVALTSLPISKFINH